MRCNVARVVAGAWKSWKSGGFRGPPPNFGGTWLQLNWRNDWKLLLDGVVSIRALNRRIRLRYTTGDPLLRTLLEARGDHRLHGALLVHRPRGWYLDIRVVLKERPSYIPATPIGVDRGVACLAVARAIGSKPLIIRGGRIKSSREYHQRLRARLQAKGTRPAHRLIKKASRHERRYFLDQARSAARLIVNYALGFERPVLVLEDILGIQKANKRVSRGRAGSRLRFSLNTWAYARLFECISCASEDSGVLLAFVSPAWTSRTCPRCGDARDGNRRGATFRCGYCGYQNHADVVGATNLARRWLHEHAPQPWGRVNGPDGCEERGHVPDRGGLIFDAQAAQIGLC